MLLPWPPQRPTALGPRLRYIRTTAAHGLTARTSPSKSSNCPTKKSSSTSTVHERNGISRSTLLANPQDGGHLGQASLTRLREVSSPQSNTATTSSTPSSPNPASSPNSWPIPSPHICCPPRMPRLALLCSEPRSISSSTPTLARSTRPCSKS